MRQFLCCHCAKEAPAAIDGADLPLDWAQITFERAHVVDDRPTRTTLMTHACGDCTVKILVFLEKAPAVKKPIDDAFDHGGGE